MSANDFTPPRSLRIGQLLVGDGKLSEEQLQDALAQQTESGGRLGEILVQMGALDSKVLMEFLAQRLDLPIVNLHQYTFAPDVVRLLPEHRARRYKAIVLADNEDSLTVGMVDPMDIFAYDQISATLQRPIRLALVDEDDLFQAIDTVYRRSEEIVTLASELSEEIDEGTLTLDLDAGSESATDAPVARLLQSIFEDATRAHASDIHIEPEEGLVRVRQRVDGFLQEQVIREKKIAAALVTRLKLVSGLDIAEKRLPQDGRFAMNIGDTSIDVRISTMPVQNGESVVMRLLDQSASLLTLDQLGMPADTLRRFRQLIARPHGMVLVTGPTGSGKTTTLYAALNHINNAHRKIITVEDPVEYRLPRINQVQVAPKIGLSFARVLRSCLRQDPDVIMVGEMRDDETVEIGIRAAMTGHLVFSTLHTNDAIATVHRLVDMGAEGYMAATALNAVIAQRLVRRVCASCATDYKPSNTEMTWLRGMIGEAADTNMQFRHGAGCTYCNQTGYRGRAGIYEFLEMDAGMAEALREKAFPAFEAAAAAQANYQPLVMAGIEYVRQGITTLREIIRVAGSVEDTDVELDSLAAQIEDESPGEAANANV